VNHTCNGEVVKADGKLYYRCLKDGPIFKIIVPPEVCPNCNRSVPKRYQVMNKSELRTLVQIQIKTAWGWQTVEEKISEPEN